MKVFKEQIKLIGQISSLKFLITETFLEKMDVVKHFYTFNSKGNINEEKLLISTNMFSLTAGKSTFYECKIEVKL